MVGAFSFYNKMYGCIDKNNYYNNYISLYFSSRCLPALLVTSRSAHSTDPFETGKVVPANGGYIYIVYCYDPKINRHSIVYTVKPV